MPTPNGPAITSSFIHVQVFVSTNKLNSFRCCDTLFVHGTSNISSFSFSLHISLVLSLFIFCFVGVRLQTIDRLANGDDSPIDIFIRNWSIRTEINRRAYFYNVVNNSTQSNGSMHHSDVGGGSAASSTSQVPSLAISTSSSFISEKATVAMAKHMDDDWQISTSSIRSKFSHFDADGSSTMQNERISLTSHAFKNNSNRIKFRQYCTLEYEHQYCNKSKVPQHTTNSFVSFNTADTSMRTTTTTMTTTTATTTTVAVPQEAKTFTKGTTKMAHASLSRPAAGVPPVDGVQMQPAESVNSNKNKKAIETPRVTTAIASAMVATAAAAAAAPPLSTPMPITTVSTITNTGDTETGSRTTSSATAKTEFICNKLFTINRKAARRKFHNKRPKLKTENTFITRLFVTNIIDTI